MATIKLANLIGDNLRVDAALTILAHDGRLFLGETMADRQETNRIALAQTVLSLAKPEGAVYLNRTVYLTPKPKEKEKSRADRWSEAAGDAQKALEDLKAVQEEYQEWLDNLGDSFEGSGMKEKLEDITNIDIEGALDTVEEAASADLPVGFGRD